MIADFNQPASKDITATIETLARMSRFIIADVSDPSSVPHELASIAPFLRTTPILPIKLHGGAKYTLFKDLRAYPWVLPIYEYLDGPSLIVELSEVIKPANDMAEGLGLSLE